MHHLHSHLGTFLVVQWLRIHLNQCRDVVQSLMWNKVSHAMGQLSRYATTRGILRVAVKTQHSQNKHINKHNTSILQMRKLGLGELQTPTY